jgi:hypothetical protein
MQCGSELEKEVDRLSDCLQVKGGSSKEEWGGKVINGSLIRYGDAPIYMPLQTSFDNVGQRLCRNHGDGFETDNRRRSESGP